MNRSLAPQIEDIQHIHTGFPESNNNLFCIDSQEGVFKLDIIYPNAGYAHLGNKFIGIMAMDLLCQELKKITLKKFLNHWMC